MLFLRNEGNPSLRERERRYIAVQIAMTDLGGWCALSLPVM